jgi:hypothetical protein
VQAVRALLENLIRDAMEPGAQIEAKIFSFARLHNIDIAQPHALDDAKLVVLSLSEDRADSVQELLSEIFEFLVCCELKDNAVLRYENA